MSSMSRLTAFTDWLFLKLPKRLRGRAVAAIALILYPGVGLVLPMALGWSAAWLVSANLLGVLFAADLSLGWLIAQIQARDRRHLLEWTTNLRLLEAAEFEWLVGEVFKREGWTVERQAARPLPMATSTFVCAKAASIASFSASDGRPGKWGRPRSGSLLARSPVSTCRRAPGSS
jgi:hypothetical protein